MLIKWALGLLLGVCVDGHRCPLRHQNCTEFMNIIINIFSSKVGLIFLRSIEKRYVTFLGGFREHNIHWVARNWSTFWKPLDWFVNMTLNSNERGYNYSNQFLPANINNFLTPLRYQPTRSHVRKKPSAISDFNIHFFVKADPWYGIGQLYPILKILL